MKAVHALPLLLATLACATRTPMESPSSKTTPSPSGERPGRGGWVLLARGTESAVLAECFDPPLLPRVTEYWQPTEAQIALADAAFQIKVDQMRDFYRQYAGVVLDGRRLITVSGFHFTAPELLRDAPRPFDWKRDPMPVCGGGTNFFHGAFDPETRHVVAFRFNAEI